MTDGRETFVLGAGFSRAISDAMPLTDDIGRELALKWPEEFADLDHVPFETWLSHRAEPQPYLDTAANLERAAVFARAVQLAADAVDGAARTALQDPLPRWLSELITVWHLRCAQVLTFNYDALVETAYDSMRLWDWREGVHAPWGSLLAFNPRGIPGASINEFSGWAPPHATFRLWKLHGSTNWFWVPGDATGVSAVRVDLPGAFGAPSEPLGDSRYWKAPGREPLLIPPSAVKSPYYTSPISREIWQRAFDALMNADIITLLGYSIPATDLTTVGMLGAALADSRPRTIRVVDRAPKLIVERLQELAPAHVTVECLGDGDESVPSYVTSLVSNAAEELVAELGRSSDAPDMGVVVTWGDIRRDDGEMLGRTAAVVGVRVVGMRAQLRIGRLGTLEQVTAITEPRALTVGGLTRALASAVREIVVDVDVDGTASRPRVIASAHAGTGTGQGTGRWLQLVPAGESPVAGL